MGSEGNGDRAFHRQRGGGGRTLNSPSPGMVTNSTPDKVSGATMFSDSMVRPPNGGDTFCSSNNWDPLVSLNQSGNLGNSSTVPPREFANSRLIQNQTLGSSSHLVHFTSDSGLVDMLPKIPSFGREFVSEMVGPYGLIAESGCKSNVANKRWLGTQSTSPNIPDSQENCQNSEGGVLGPSPFGKRKRKVPLGASPESAEEQLKDPPGDKPEFPKEDDEKKQKLEQNIGQNSGSKQAKGSNGAESSKENYIHVRAKRGQATNSHSLAERVRREKISERMRLLQELVPGCNKITGKAMMLDEIINYVQSLQQQVEFLSMKLATVNPELNLDIDRILSKDSLHLHGSHATTHGIAPGLSSLHPFPGYPFNGTLGTNPPFHALPQPIWNNELHGILQTGFDADPSACSLGSNGMSKTEL